MYFLAFLNRPTGKNDCVMYGEKGKICSHKLWTPRKSVIHSLDRSSKYFF